MNIEEINKEILKIDDINDIRNLNDLKVRMVGKKGLITSLYSKMKELSDDDKKAFGKEINDLKVVFSSKFEERMRVLEDEEVLCVFNNSDSSASISINSQLKAINLITKNVENLAKINIEGFSFKVYKIIK